jgi:hypothetical protein
VIRLYDILSRGLRLPVGKHGLVPIPVENIRSDTIQEGLVVDLVRALGVEDVGKLFTIIDIHRDGKLNEQPFDVLARDVFLIVGALPQIVENAVGTAIHDGDLVTEHVENVHLHRAHGHAAPRRLRLRSKERGGAGDVLHTTRGALRRDTPMRDNDSGLTFRA